MATILCVEEMNGRQNMDLAAENQTLYETQVVESITLISDMWRLIRKLEWILLQKSRLSWAQKGDTNNRFFHLMASNRVRNALNSLWINKLAELDFKNAMTRFEKAREELSQLLIVIFHF